MNQRASGTMKQIAIFGGGISALTTAFELTSIPDWQQRYDITLYQMGWRLGGKTATGRGINDRIEERGIHIFQGWYNNAFRMMQSVYRERKEMDICPQCPYQDWTDVFLPDSTTLLTEWSPTQGKWLNWPIVFPTNNLTPGSTGNPSVWEMLAVGLELFLETLFGTDAEKGTFKPVAWLEEAIQSKLDTPPSTEKHSLLEGIFKHVESAFHHVTAPVELMLVHHAVDIAKKLITWKPEHLQPGDTHPLHLLVVSLEASFTWLVKLVEDLMMHNDHIRRTVTVFEWALVSIKGMLEDLYDPETHTLIFSRIDNMDYRAWLKKNGASDLVLHAGPVRFIYTGTFANLYGYEQGQVSAGAGVQMTLLFPSYKGAFVYKLRLGTGDTLIAPLYQVLKKRGVKFKFFNKVESIRYSTTGEIEEVIVAEQVQLKTDEYDPLIWIDGKVPAWPAQPRYAFINDEQAAKLQEENINLESNWSPWENWKAKTLVRGTDFDQIVLGIPVAALKTICSDLMNNDTRWKNMIEKVRTTPTFNFQLWLKPSLKELGMNLSEWGMPEGIEPNTVSYANLAYSWIDMTRIIQQERWPAANMPQCLFYFCGTFPEDGPTPPPTDVDYPTQQYWRSFYYSEQWLRDSMGWFWPAATALEEPQGMSFDVLANPTPDRPLANLDLLKAQYFAVNVDPSNRFSIAWPNTNQYRMKADGSGFSNLVLTGDWIDFGLNIGYTEGAVISGLQAANAVLATYGEKGIEIL